MKTVAPILFGCVLAAALSVPALATRYQITAVLPADAPPHVYYAFYPPTGTSFGANMWLAVIGLTPKCNGSSACAYATISGGPRRPLGRGKVVRLSDGTPAVFVAASCAHTASCTPSRLLFDRGDETIEIDKQIGTFEQMNLLATNLKPIRR